MRYGVSYFGVRDPRHAARDLDEIAAAGFLEITHTFSEHDLRHHVDDVGRLVEMSRARGLTVALDPWGVGGLFGGEAYSEHALVRLEARQVDAEGTSVPASCPHHPSTRELLARWTREAVGLGPDLLFWDEPHFYLGAWRGRPSPPCCRCHACAHAWRETGADGPLPPEGDAALEAFRGHALRRLLSEMIEAAGDGVRHSLCLLPRGEFAGAGSDAWEEFAAVPGLARLATDPYWMDRPVDPAAFVRDHAAPLRTLCDTTGHEMEVWVQGIRIAAGDEPHLTAACETAAGCGADVISFWSFRGTERMASLTCADPDAAWAAMIDAVRRIR